MAAIEHVQAEQRSSVKISQTAKGDPVVEVKIYDGTDAGEIEAAREMAVAVFRQTVADVRARHPALDDSRFPAGVFPTSTKPAAPPVNPSNRSA